MAQYGGQDYSGGYGQDDGGMDQSDPSGGYRPANGVSPQGQSGGYGQSPKQKQMSRQGGQQGGQSQGGYGGPQGGSGYGGQQSTAMTKQDPSRGAGAETDVHAIVNHQGLADGPSPLVMGPHGHMVHESHLPHHTHQKGVEALTQIHDHGWDPSHTKALGHIATFAYAKFGRWMGFC